MKDSRDRVEELAAGYWSATLTQSEEQELRQAIEARGNYLSKELEALKIMLGGFETLAQEFEAPIIPLPKRRNRMVEMIATLTASAAILAFGTVVNLNGDAPSEQEIYCYINGEPITDINVAMEQTKYLESLATLSETIDVLETIMLN